MLYLMGESCTFYLVCSLLVSLKQSWVLCGLSDLNYLATSCVRTIIEDSGNTSLNNLGSDDHIHTLVIRKRILTITFMMFN